MKAEHPVHKGHHNVPADYLFTLVAATLTDHDYEPKGQELEI